MAPTSAPGYPLDAKTRVGVALLGVSQSITNALITGVLLLYLTDYAGLFSGVPGAAAAAATVMLVVGRIWDAVNDPILGFVMDRTPRGRWGRFKPYITAAIPSATILLILLFNLPQSMDDVLKLTTIYILYLLFDTAFTLMPIYPLIQTLTADNVVRSKLLGPPRVIGLVAAAAMAAFIPVAYALGPDPATPNFGIAVVIFLVPAAAVSLSGILMVKEGDANVGEATVSLRDVWLLVRTNKPFWISQLAAVFQGFTWTMLFAGANYYVKYALGADQFGTTSAIFGVVMITGNLLGVPASQLLLRRFTPGMTFIWVCGFTAVPFAALFLLNLGGPITNPWLLFPLTLLLTFGIGMAFIPGTVIGMQVADYNKYRIGKSMQGTLGATAGFIQKLQGAVAAAVTGAVLVAVGYDAEAFENADAIPPELFDGLGLVVFGLPGLLSLIGGAVMVWYPLLKRKDQDAVYAAIDEAKAASSTAEVAID